jgi:hypothetical protein
MLSLWASRDLKRDDPGGEGRGDHDPDGAATAPPVAAGVVDSPPASLLLILGVLRLPATAADRAVGALSESIRAFMDGSLRKIKG